MPGDQNVTIRVDKTTKAALDIFAAKEYARTGVSLTNTQTIHRLLEMADPEALFAALKAGRQQSPKLDEGDTENSE